MQNSYRRNLLDQARTPMDTTDILETFKNYDIQPVDNDGVHYCVDYKQEPKSTNPQYTRDQEVEVYLTNSSVHVTEFSNSFIRFDITETVTFDSITIANIKAKFPRLFKNAQVAENADDDEHERLLEEMLAKNQFVFIGYKASAQAFSTYGFKSNGEVIQQASQQEAIPEQFFYYVFKSATDIANKKYVYSPYDEVATYDNSICGMFVSLYDILQNDGRCTITFPMVVPYNELLCLQSFDQFPNFLFGSLHLLFKCSPVGEVWTQVNPIESLSKNITRGIINASEYPELTSVLACPKETWGFTRAFQQIGLISDVCFCTGMGYDEDSHKFDGGLQFYAGHLCPVCTTYYVSNISTYSKGYKISSAAADTMSKYFLAAEFGGDNHVFTVCGQRIDGTLLGSGQSTKAQGLTALENVKFCRTTDCIITMPHVDGLVTCFINPCVVGYQLHIGDVAYSHQEMDTFSPEFYMSQLQATDFDTFFQATDSYEHSLTDVRCNDEKFLKPVTDDTNFVICHSLERKDAGRVVFDGLDGNFSVRLKATPAYSDAPLYSEMNKDPNNHGNQKPPTPKIWMCQDTYWIFRRVKAPDGRWRVSAQYVRINAYRNALVNRSLEGIEANLGGYGDF